MTAPTPVPTPPIVFGTDGWRARIGEDYTYENVRRCAQGVAEWLHGAGTAGKGVIVGYDRRFSSRVLRRRPPRRSCSPTTSRSPSRRRRSRPR